jgi:hypothetical protein
VISLRKSGAGRWVPCPASPRLEAPFPDVESEDAKEGTAAHWVAAQVLGGHRQLEELTDRTAPNGVIVTGEMVEHVESYTTRPREGVPVVERPLPSAIPGVEDGTPDALWIVSNRGFIDDLKYGYGIVEVVGNWQLASYAVDLFVKHEWQLEAVTVTIVQPRPYHPDGRVRSWTITRDVGWQLSQHLQQAAQRAHDPNSPAATGPHCKNCRALHACEAARRAGMNGVDVSLAASAPDLPADALAGELRQLRRAADAIKLRLDALESHGLATIDRGGIIPGWIAERSLGRRRWKDPAQITFLEAITGKSLHETKPVSPAQAEKCGVDSATVKIYTETPVTGRKLVERDGSQKASEVFG